MKFYVKVEILFACEFIVHLWLFISHQVITQTFKEISSDLNSDRLTRLRNYIVSWISRMQSSIKNYSRAIISRKVDLVHLAHTNNIRSRVNIKILSVFSHKLKIYSLSNRLDVLILNGDGKRLIKYSVNVGKLSH